ncbi:MAG: hypothetical protein JW958_13310 [Candidatus Eisenbacteria bacterium]|nr:hypothetical protein [Candidatus Eisenbacteria bacterium]
MRRTLFAVAVPAALSLALAAGASRAEDRLFAVTTDYETIGSCAEIDLDPPFPAATGLEPVGADPLVRFWRNEVYVINRLYADNIQVLDPDSGYETTLEFSVGAGSNPQDIAFLAPDRAYVSRFESAWLYEVNPATGAILDSIDLSLFADADGLPEMSSMAVWDGFVFVQIQRIERPYWTPVSPAWLAVIDPSTNALVDVDPGTPGVQGIELTGLNPRGQMILDEENGDLYVAEMGEYFSLDGGVERVDLNGWTAEGFVVTEAALHGDLGPIALSGGAGWAVVSDDWFFTNHLVAFDPSTGALLDTLYTTTGYVSDLEADAPTGRLFLCDRKETAPGVHVFDAASGARLTSSPVNTGLPPADVVVVRPITAGVATPGEEDRFPAGRAARALPNPFRSGTTILFHAGAGASPPAAASIYDIRGRLVRDIPIPPGAGSIDWDGRDASGRDAAPGVYFYRIDATPALLTGRMVRVR